MSYEIANSTAVLCEIMLSTVNGARSLQSLDSRGNKWEALICIDGDKRTNKTPASPNTKANIDPTCSEEMDGADNKN